MRTTIWTVLALWAEVAAAGSGVVVESLKEASALARAGLRSGDVVRSWSLEGGSLTASQSSGGLLSTFDWWWLEIGVAPLGPLELRGERGGRPERWTVGPGIWDAEVRPVLAASRLDLYLDGRARIEEGDVDRGIDAWRRAVELTEAPLVRSWLKLRIADALAGERRWSEAEAVLDAALEETSEPLARARVWLASGETYGKRQDWPRAEAAYRSALEIFRRRGETFGVAWCESRLGTVAQNRGDLESANAHFRRELEISERLAGDSLRVADAAVRLGWVVNRRGDLDRGEALTQRGLAIYERLAPDTLRLTASLSNLGVIAWERDDLDLAARYFGRALEIERRVAPGSTELASSLTNLANVVMDRGELNLADEYLRHALAIFEKLGPESRQRAIVLFNLGANAYHMGDFEVAKDYFRRSLDYFSEHAPGSLEQAAVLDNLGLVASRRKSFELAEELHRQALEIRRERAPGSPAVATSLLNLGDVFLEHGDLARAEESYRQALAVRESQAMVGLGMASALYSLGQVASERGDLSQAERFHRRALEIRRRLAPASTELAESLHALGHLAREGGQLERAADDLVRACEVFEAQVGKLGGSYDARSNFRARHRDLYRDAIEVSLELDRGEAAFGLLERSRARSLLAMLAERDAAFATDRLPDELRQRRRELAARYDRALGHLAGLDAETQQTEIEEDTAELARLGREREQLIAEIRAASPRLAALRYPRPLSFEEAQAALDPGTVMLSYSVGETRGSLFVVRPGAPLEVHPLPIGEAALREEVTELLEQVRRSSFPLYRSGFEAASRRLFELLIAPAAAAVASSRRLLIVPDGPLYSLPFAVLLRPPDAGEPRYLAAWKPLHSVQSATLYDEIRKSRSPAAKGEGYAVELAAFGDPTFPGAGAPGRLADPQLRAATTRGLFDWQPLPQSRHEVEEISALFPAGTARTYLGEAASEERAKALGKDVRIVHFATHALIDDRFPLNSALVLTVPGEQTGDRDNGLLQAWEIFEGLRLDAEIVVLSACRSGLGTELDGEGLIGLTRAFQYAGARSVVASLWSVDDRSTSELMVRFYRHLQAGEGKDEALRSAQLELLKGPLPLGDESGKTVMMDFSAPFYWAAFQLVGDWR